MAAVRGPEVPSPAVIAAIQFDSAGGAQQPSAVPPSPTREEVDRELLELVSSKGDPSPARGRWSRPTRFLSG